MRGFFKPFLDKLSQLLSNKKPDPETDPELIDKLNAIDEVSAEIEKASKEYELVKQVYERIKSGESVTDIKKAYGRKDITKLVKKKKLIYRDGTYFMTTVYVSPEGHESLDKKESRLEVPIDEAFYPDEFKVGDKITISAGYKTRYSEGIVTAMGFAKSYGGWYISIQNEDGKLEFFKLDKSYITKVSKVSKTKYEEITERAEKTLSEELDKSYDEGTSLGGSSDVRLIGDGKHVLKKARPGSMGTMQLKFENLVNEYYSFIKNRYKDSDNDADSFFETYVPRGRIYENGKYLLSNLIEGKTFDKVPPYQVATAMEKIRKGFVIDCLFGNRDVIGANFDNIIVTEDGNPFRIDNGGSLFFRARGEFKADFSEEVSEIDNLRDPSKNSTAATFFQNITDDDIKAQLRVLAGDDEGKSFLDSLEQITKSTLSLEDTIDLNPMTVLRRRFKYLLDRFDLGIKPVNETSKDVTTEYFKDWDKFVVDVPGNPNIKEKIKQNILDKEKIFEDRFKEWAAKRHMSVNAYKKKMQDAIEEYCANAKLFRQTDSSILQHVIEDRRYKSQFEVSNSDGAYNPTLRMQIEHKHFGFINSTEKNKEFRPIYGYFSSEEHGAQNSEGQNPPGNLAYGYGDTLIELDREKLGNRVTFTLQDSLDSDQIPQFLNKPHFTAFLNGPPGSYRYSKDPLQEYIEKTKEIGKFDSRYGSPMNSGMAYTEIQVHGGLSIDYIKKVHFSRSNMRDSYSRMSETLNKIKHLVIIKPDIELSIGP